MKKNMMVFGIVLLFFGLAITPTINSSFIQIQKDNNEEPKDSSDSIKIDIIEFKGFEGYEKITKEISSQEYKNLQTDLESINVDGLSIETQIKQRNQIFKKYGLIPEDFTYEKIQRMVKEQQAFLKILGIKGLINKKLADLKADSSSNYLMNALAFLLFFVDDVDDYNIIGLPPWKLLDPWEPLIPFPHIYVPTAWATAKFEGDGISFGSYGLLRGKYYESNLFKNFILIGFIGLTFYLLLPGQLYYRFSVMGYGYTAFLLGYE